MLARARATPPGAFMEMGVYRGGSAWHLARLAFEQHRLCYLCDTFEGIPYKGWRDSHPVGDFADTSLLQVVEAISHPAIYVPGVFPDKLGKLAVDLAFVHLDCDQEQSHREALEWCWPRLVEGGVIWFDDADCLPGAAVAVQSFLTAHGVAVHESESGKRYLVKEAACPPSR